MGGLLLLQSSGILATAELAWSAIFGGAGLAFLYAFLRGRNAYWWAAILGFALLGLATLVAWNEQGARSAEEWGASLLLGAAGLGVWAVYLVDDGRWWAIIAGGALLTLATIVGLEPVLEDATIGGLLFLGMTLTFVLLAVLPTGKGRMRWSLVPAAVLALLAALSWTQATTVLNYAWPVALMLAGLYLISRAFGSGRGPRRGLGGTSHKGG